MKMSAVQRTRLMMDMWVAPMVSVTSDGTTIEHLPPKAKPLTNAMLEYWHAEWLIVERDKVIYALDRLRFNIRYDVERTKVFPADLFWEARSVDQAIAKIVMEAAMGPQD